MAIAADCGAPAVRDLATHLLDDVASALLSSGDWRQAVAAVASRAGDDGAAAVKCAVGELLAQSSNQLALRARMEQDAADRVTLMHDRALTWLGEHPAPPATAAVPMSRLVAANDAPAPRPAPRPAPPPPEDDLASAGCTPNCLLICGSVPKPYQCCQTCNF